MCWKQRSDPLLLIAGLLYISRHSLEQDDNADELCYEEFLETLAVVAFNLCTHINSDDLGPVVLDTPVSKLRMLIFTMNESSKFEGEEVRMVHRVIPEVGAMLKYVK